jgi:1-acyl-sn-glycerol-3-phosphate acyltransferase
MLRKIIFLFVAIYMYIISVLSGLFLFVPIITLKNFNFNIGNVFKNIFYINCAFIIKNFLQVDVFVNSNKLVYNLINEPTQIILTQNHYTEIDYLFMSWFLTNLNTFNNLLYYSFITVAKKFVGNIFIGIGFYSLISKDIYLSRNITKDYRVLSKNNNCNLLYIFPEGTCFNKYTKKKSNLFIKKNKLIKYKYHLYPRTTGIYTLINTHKKFKTIYDLTVLYDTIPKNIIGQQDYLFTDFIFKYNFPNRVYINIDKIPIDNSSYLQSILEYVFIKKDNFIHNFNIEQNQFQKMDFNDLLAFGCFIFINCISYFSYLILVNSSFIQYLYLGQILTYLVYFNFFY